MRFPELPAPNTVIEVSAQDDSFNLIDVFFVPADLTPDRREGQVCGYLIRSDYARKDSDFDTPYTMNLLTHEWRYIDSPATSQVATHPGTELAEMDRQRRALEVAIGYSPVRVSIAEHPGIGYTHRTAEDRDDLVLRILDAGFRVGGAPAWAVPAWQAGINTTKESIERVLGNTTNHEEKN